ncbi:gustatory receptor for sugar taste 64a-like [Hermetia illucens]|uniref:gustatory receptor for sugar taste 64a-like n=1 Tax=Hermetia illucens TaxID=343691 RepID=UPI0018CC3D4A|nr:gustatory receptor for sugar taste 64a-like [Hermetia illucens]
MNVFRRNNRVKDRTRVNINVPARWGYYSSFHEAVSPVIFWAQFFGVMPLKNVRLPDPEHVEFRWRSWRLLGTYAFLIWNFVVSVLFLRYLLLIGITARNTVSLVFFTMSQLSYGLFLLLARKWPKMMAHWLDKESKFLHPPYTSSKDHLKRDVKLTTVVIGLLAIFEHIMFQASTIYTFYIRVTQCQVESEDYIRLYYTEHYPHVFSALPYNHVLAVMIQVLSFTSTFVWNFMDLFIILISIGLTKRFKQLNERLLRAMEENPNRPEAFFREIRLDFITLYDILGYADKEMSFIILLSCLNNLYFICYQLMNIFQKLRFPINYGYFWMSLLYLMGRSAYLFLQASTIQDVSRVPVKILAKTPRGVWCTEIDRFLYQIHTETIALSAMGLFHFTRKLFFSMVGTFMTIELVIIQFDLTSRDHELPPLCE